jgi:hypothetical protein
VGHAILIIGSGRDSTGVESARLYLLWREVMQGETINTTYRELIQLRLIYKYADAIGLEDLDGIYKDVDKRIILDENVLKKMGLN